MEEIDFLSSTTESIRLSVKGIDDSYRNPWDIYAELAQNSMDAIHKMQKEHDEIGKITIEIDAQQKSIVFSDNGCGISDKDLPGLLRPFSSGKSGDNSSVGEKGVGLKFVLFQSSYFEITSSDGKTCIKAIVKNACTWKKDTSDEMLKLVIENVDDISRGTSVRLEGIELLEDEDQTTSIFDLSFEQLVFVLRNKTFLGETTYLWEEPKLPIEIFLTYIDSKGNKRTEPIKNEYILPIESLSKNDIVDIDEFEKWLKITDRADIDKRNKLQGKVLITKGRHTYKTRKKIIEISYWACFVPSRGYWDKINESTKLVSDIKEEDSTYTENNEYYMFNSGIYLATRGMPTGLSVDVPKTGYDGYWHNCFMIFQDNSADFDIGRKSISIQSSKRAYYSLAKNLFAKITKYVTRYTSATSGNIASTNITFDRYNIRQELSKLVELNSTNVVFQKVPSEQEASVSAIFFELVGNRKIDDIEPIYFGYRNKYDLYANYVSREDGKRYFKFIEFKSHLRNITKDFSGAKKVFDEVDYIVCWDVNDSDVRALSKFGISCEKVKRGTLHIIDCPKAVTHRLDIPNCNPVYVIDLKQMM